MKIVTPILTAVTMAALTTSSALAVNIAVNGGFESGDTSGWDDFAAPQFFGTANASPFEGSFNGIIDNQNDGGFGAVIKNSNLGAGSLISGAVVTISFQARGSAGPGGVHFAEFFSEGSMGVSKSEILGGAPLFPPSATNWTFYSFNTTLGPDVTNGATLQFNAATGAVAGSFAILEIDNVVVDTIVVPEPTAAAFLGLGFLGLLRRRRS